MHDQQTALQSYETAQCALAMLFDLHVRAPDVERQRVCDAFHAHPDRVAQKRGAKTLDDRSANHAMLSLYEAWLLRAHRTSFEAAREWREANSLRIGDLLSSGVCDVCDLFDTPASLLLCADESCPRAIHTFCRAGGNHTACDGFECDDWWCPEHAPEEASPGAGADEL